MSPPHLFSRSDSTTTCTFHSFTLGLSRFHPLSAVRQIVNARRRNRSRSNVGSCHSFPAAFVSPYLLAGQSGQRAHEEGGTREIGVKRDDRQTNADTLRHTFSATPLSSIEPRAARIAALRHETRSFLRDCFSLPSALTRFRSSLRVRDVPSAWRAASRRRGQRAADPRHRELRWRSSFLSFEFPLLANPLLLRCSSTPVNSRVQARIHLKKKKIAKARGTWFLKRGNGERAEDEGEGEGETLVALPIPIPIPWKRLAKNETRSFHQFLNAVLRLRPRDSPESTRRGKVSAAEQRLSRVIASLICALRTPPIPIPAEKRACRVRVPIR